MSDEDKPLERHRRLPDTEHFEFVDFNPQPMWRCRSCHQVFRAGYSPKKCSMCGYPYQGKFAEAFHIVSIRLTWEEYDELVRKSGEEHISHSSYIRRKVFGEEKGRVSPFERLRLVSAAGKSAETAKSPGKHSSPLASAASPPTSDPADPD